jgi:hypothetical protein
VLWFIVWTLLVLLSVAVLGRLAWVLFRKGVGLAQEMGEAAERLSAIADEVEKLGNERQRAHLAVFADPQQLRRERDQRERERRRRRARAARRRTTAS